MSIRIVINPEKLVNNHKLVQWYRLFGAECLSQAQAIAASKIHGGTGKYMRSFTTELIPGSPPTLRFGNSAPHAIFLEEGTTAHVIAPVNAKALRWFDPAPPKGRKKGNKADAVFSAGPIEVSGIKAMHIVRTAVKEAGDNLRGGGHRAAFFD